MKGNKFCFIKLSRQLQHFLSDIGSKITHNWAGKEKNLPKKKPLTALKPEFPLPTRRTLVKVHLTQNSAPTHKDKETKELTLQERMSLLFEPFVVVIFFWNWRDQLFQLQPMSSSTRRNNRLSYFSVTIFEVNSAGTLARSWLFSFRIRCREALFTVVSFLLSSHAHKTHTWTLQN